MTWRQWLIGLLITLALAAPVLAGEVVTARVVKIVDGDTIHVTLAGTREKVRYIGMNTPEVHHPTKGEQTGRAGGGGRQPAPGGGADGAPGV
jgi:endonuclease YncB( thermonuclease family)